MQNRIEVLDKGYVELQDVMGDDNAIVAAARVSFLGHSKGAEADRKLIGYLMKHNHTSPFEQVEFKFRIKCPIFVARQWHRHRTWNYNETSRRYTSEEIDFYVPDEWRAQSKSDKQASDSAIEIDESIQKKLNEQLLNLIDAAECLYTDMLANGIAREQARMVLPQNMYTIFIAKTDAHNLMHFLRLRLDKHAQYEIRVYAQALYEFFKQSLPWTAEFFDRTMI